MEKWVQRFMDLLDGDFVSRGVPIAVTQILESLRCHNVYFSAIHVPILVRWLKFSNRLPYLTAAVL